MLEKFRTNILKFAMNFLKGVVAICHCFRSTGQLGRINGFDRCFRVVDRCTTQRRLSEKSFVLFIRCLSLARPLRDLSNGLTYSALKFMWSTCDKSKLGAIELFGTPVLARPQILKFYHPHMGKQKPKTSIIARTYAKTVDSLCARICLRTSNLLDTYLISN